MRSRGGGGGGGEEGRDAPAPHSQFSGHEKLEFLKNSPGEHVTESPVRKNTCERKRFCPLPQCL